MDFMWIRRSDEEISRLRRASRINPWPPLIIALIPTGFYAPYPGSNWKCLLFVFLIRLVVAFVSQFASRGRFVICLDPTRATSFADDVVICSECRTLQQSVSTCSKCGGLMEEARFWMWIPDHPSQKSTEITD